MHLYADVTREDAVQAAVAQVLAREERVDILICCAGFGISGAAEFTDNRDAKRLMDVNLFGTVNAVKAVLPAMRRQGSGRIICVSSVAAPISIPFQAWYSVSKAAISSYAAALREEVKPFGISVCAVLPRDVCTGFTDAREKSTIGDDIYNGRIQRSVSRMEHDERTGMKPETAGQFLAAVALRKRVKPYYAIAYTGAVLISRFLPCSLVIWIVSKLYAS